MNVISQGKQYLQSVLEETNNKTRQRSCVCAENTCPLWADDKNINYFYVEDILYMIMQELKLYNVYKVLSSLINSVNIFWLSGFSDFCEG